MKFKTINVFINRKELFDYIKFSTCSNTTFNEQLFIEGSGDMVQHCILYRDKYVFAFTFGHETIQEKDRSDFLYRVERRLLN